MPTSAAADMPSSTDGFLDRLLEAVHAELDGAVALRHHLHATAEPSHAEEATAATIAAALPVRAVTAAGTGRLARVGDSEGWAVAVRAELDGLPIQERTGAAFASRDGVMHACGHDVHASALVALVRAAHRLAGELPAPLLAVFQPSEEAYPSGAELLDREGALGDRVRAVVGAHVHPDVPWGSLAVDDGPVNASSDVLAITIEGSETHAAYPHMGRDAVLALADAIVTLHTQAGRRLDPLAAAVGSVTQVRAGTAENAIPGEAQASVVVRALSPADRALLLATVSEVMGAVARAHGCEARVRLTSGEPVLDNDRTIVAAARALAPQCGFVLAPRWRSCGSDDLAYFGTTAPLVMAFAGLAGAPGFVPRPLHHPEFLPPDAAVGAMARALAVLYVAAAQCPLPKAKEDTRT